jgi:hypothetical protein
MLKWVFLYSDDGDHYESDSERGTHTRRGREYRDKDSDSLDSTEKRDHNNSKPATPARTKPTAANVKKLDLGAAAHYGKDSGSLVSNWLLCFLSFSVFPSAFCPSYFSSHTLLYVQFYDFLL